MGAGGRGGVGGSNAAQPAISSATAKAMLERVMTINP
jgi:hypothetical protein